jgi:hypothetical protein
MSEWRRPGDHGWWLHGVVGFALNAVFIWILWGWPWWTGFVTAPVVLALGYVREKNQHKWQALEWPHQVVEAVTWGLGALLAAIVATPLALLL